MNILSIQSWVAYGHAGNASAMFPLQRLGAEVWAINTAQLSNHTGYESWTGGSAAPQSVRALIDGVEARGALARCDAVLSGYIGAAATGGAVLHAVARTRLANPAAVYCCDPVIGDEGKGVYVQPDIPAFLRDQALPQADIATPNHFELKHLMQQPCATLGETKAALAALSARMRPGGLGAVLLTSAMLEDTPPGTIDLLAYEAGAFWRVRTERLTFDANGAGDVIAALFLFHRLVAGHSRPALESAAAAVFSLLHATQRGGSRELLIVAAQQEFVVPSFWFAASPC